MYGLGDIDFGAIESTSNPTLEKDAQEAIRLAKFGTIAITVLQAIAAFSALGIVAIQYAQYAENRRKSRRSSRRTR